MQIFEREKNSLNCGIWEKMSMACVDLIERKVNGMSTFAHWGVGKWKFLPIFCVLQNIINLRHLRPQLLYHSLPCHRHPLCFTKLYKTMKTCFSFTYCMSVCVILFLILFVAVVDEHSKKRQSMAMQSAFSSSSFSFSYIAILHTMPQQYAFPGVLFYTRELSVKRARENTQKAVYCNVEKISLCDLLLN